MRNLPDGQPAAAGHAESDHSDHTLVDTTNRAGAEPEFPAANRQEPLFARMELSARLRGWRRAAGLSRTVAGGIIGDSADAIERIEHPHGQVVEPDIAALLTGYDVTDPGDVAQVQDLVRRVNQPRWWQPDADLVPTWFERFLDLEQASTNIRGYECQWVPGLLQTRDYARALIGIEHTDHDTMERRVALRLRRQERALTPDLGHAESGHGRGSEMIHDHGPQELHR